MKRSEFVFDNVDLLHYKFHKICLYCGGSYIDPPDQLENKKQQKILKKKDGKCFQYSVAAALSLKQIKIHAKRMSKIKPFINEYNWR